MAWSSLPKTTINNRPELPAHPPEVQPEQPAVAGRDPLSSFLADPQSHLADILYLYFRWYKRELIGRFFDQATARLAPRGDAPLVLADIGASMGFDFQYVLNCRTDGFSRSPPWARTVVYLIEGKAWEVASGEQEWALVGGKADIAHHYLQADIVQDLQLADGSCDVALCSEVVEHLVEPDRL